MAWVWFYFGLLTTVVLIWVWLNLATMRRGSLCQTLQPWDEPEQDAGREHAQALPQAQLHETAAGMDVEQAPAVAILVPGRNEALHLPRTLPALCEQDYPACRVVFIDDDSDDPTPRITAHYAQRYPHLSVLRNNAPPPPGWVGKCWALKRGYDHLQTLEHRQSVLSTHPESEVLPAGPVQWICFTDADIDWDLRCLRSAMALAKVSGADVVALGPRLVFGSTSEAVVQLQLMLAMGLMLPLDKAMDPDYPDTLTGGAFILVRRELYDRIGGHEAVRDRVLDDINLGRKLKAAGGRVRLVMAPRLLWARMYASWSQMWEGLTKNAYPALEYRPHLALGLGTLVLVANVLPPVYLLGSAIWCIVSPSPLSGAAVGLAALSVALPARVMHVMCKLMALPARYAWSMPVGSAIYLAILIASMWRYYRGGNVWKGRAYGRTTVAGEG